MDNVIAHHSSRAFQTEMRDCCKYIVVWVRVVLIIQSKHALLNSGWSGDPIVQPWL